MLGMLWGSHGLRHLTTAQAMGGHDQWSQQGRGCSVGAIELVSKGPKEGPL